MKSERNRDSVRNLAGSPSYDSVAKILASFCVLRPSLGDSEFNNNGLIYLMEEKVCNKFQVSDRRVREQSSSTS